MDLPTRLDLYSLGRDYIVQRATKIDPAKVDFEGSDANIFVGVVSVVVASVVRQLSYRLAALTLGAAEDDDLDRYVYDRYQLERKGASPALTTLTLSRATVTGGPGTVPVGTRVATVLGVEYLLTSPASFGATDTTSSATVRAAQAGKATQVGAGEILRFADPTTLFDRTLQCVNVEAAAGGEDREEDDVFRARVRQFWRSARRGILAAIEFGALTVPGVVSAMAVESLDGGARPARIVSLYIADSSGVASRALGDLVQSALNEYRAGGIAVVISTSIPLVVDIQLRLTFRANVDTLTLTNEVRAAVTEFVNSIPVNGTLYVAQLYSVLQRYAEDGLIPDEGSIVAPAGDLVPDVGQTIRTTLAQVTTVTA